MALHFDRNQEATVWIGGLDENVNEALLWELMIQAGPVVSVNIPRDKITREHSGYAFCEFASEEDADYAMKIMNMVRLYGKSLKINKASRDRKDTGVGANVFVGNLDPEVDDQLLYNTFSAFGQVLSAKVMYEDDGSSRGFAFVNFADFESSDAAMLHMNGQFLCNRPVHVSYAYKKDTKGEKHGSETERLFAAKMQAKSVSRPHMHFASTAPQLSALAALSNSGSTQQQIPNRSLMQQQQANRMASMAQQNSMNSMQVNRSLMGHQPGTAPNSSLMGMMNPMGSQYTPETAQALQNAALIQQAAMMQQQQMVALQQQARILQQHQQRAQQVAMAAAVQRSQQQKQQQKAPGPPPPGPPPPPPQGGEQKNNGNPPPQKQQQQPPPPPNPNMFMRGPPPPNRMMGQQPPPPPPGMFVPGYPPGMYGPRPPFMGRPPAPQQPMPPPPPTNKQPVTNKDGGASKSG